MPDVTYYHYNIHIILGNVNVILKSSKQTTSVITTQGEIFQHCVKFD